jgi:hypothetical protein
MQRGSVRRVSRKRGPGCLAVSLGRKGDLNRHRVYRKKVLGSVGRYADEAAELISARTAQRSGEIRFKGLILGWVHSADQIRSVLKNAASESTKRVLLRRCPISWWRAQYPFAFSISPAIKLDGGVLVCMTDFSWCGLRPL